MATQINDDEKFTDILLPKCIKPIHYTLKLKPNFENFTFAGRVEIDYECGESDVKPQSVVLHAIDLVITDGELKGELNSGPLSTVTYSKDSETATLEFQNGVASVGKLCLNFTGILNDKLKGFYRTSFMVDGTNVYGATTQLAATDARRCFPCWDEPATKATFSVSCVTNKFVNINGKQYEMVALSNMPEESRVATGDEIHVSFAKTPIMSTYLLAFIIGPFESIESTDSKRPVRVFTIPGKTEQGKFALDVTCKSLQFYEDYFQVEYALPKMDLIAIPDFCSGAMENWGLVTYRETCLLVDPHNTSTRTKQYVAIVVAHEIAHQWFGNLVTMEWWTHLWLNEGFASFMEYLCVDHLFPEYDIWSQFVTDAHNRALNLDALHNSHPIEVPVKLPSEIDEIFDAISYSKGASAIRMLYTYIGDDCFRKGMNAYLNKFAFKNAATEDLWDSLEAASNKPVRKLMSGWTSQKGYPWLSVSYSQKESNVVLTLTQNKFSADGKLPDNDAQASWMIPISAVTGDNPSQVKDMGLMDKKTTDVTIEGVGDAWVKLNPGTIGLYRVAYPEEMAAKLLPAISDKTLAPMDRLGLQSDFYALCQAGKVSTVELMKLLQAFRGETDFNVWTSIDSGMGHLNLLLSNTDFQDQFHAYGRELYNDIFAKLTWTPKAGEQQSDSMNRALVINRLVSFGDKGVIEEAKRLFDAHVKKSESILPDLRSAVYRAVATFGDDQSFENLFTIYKTADLPEEKNRVLRALGFTKDNERLQRVLKLTMSDEVRDQDKVYAFISVGATHPSAAWKLFQDNKDLLREKYGTNHLMTSIAKHSTEYFASDEIAEEVAAFFQKNSFSGTERTVQQSIETIRLNSAWLKRDQAAIKAFLTA